MPWETPFGNLSLSPLVEAAAGFHKPRLDQSPPGQRSSGTEANGDDIHDTSFEQYLAARPSGVTKGKYNRWLVAEQNRVEAGEQRQDVAQKLRTEQQRNQEFLDATHERTQQHKQERDAAKETVRRARLEKAERAKEQKEAVQSAVQQSEEQSRQYTALLQQLGRQHRIQLQESRVEKERALLAVRRAAVCTRRPNTAHALLPPPPCPAAACDASFSFGRPRGVRSLVFALPRAHPNANLCWLRVRVPCRRPAS
jgi:hypothetical protein